ncbi:UNKNOWN [Stylonychia lemnae]|uniref:Uncharacterized protein n=1 Tax=Stylonychia lemnae TaxID=5949 RepID=A0A078ARX3_STYLE|nr:UNKNOWN [Stylonychia lemnae]|eukprot:CDW83633.1 UNKNOWN [Stylonychia lemnae]
MSANQSQNKNQGAGLGSIGFLGQNKNLPTLNLSDVEGGVNDKKWHEHNSFAISPIKGSFTMDQQEQQNLRKLEQEFSKLNIKEIQPNGGGMGNHNMIASRNNSNQIQFNDSSDDFLPIVYEIEEIDCRMTDMEERDKNDQNGGNSNRSVRGSLFNSPKDFPIIIPSNKINESQVSILSHNNLAMFDNMKQFQDLLRYDTDRNLDISMSSVCSTPRNQFLPQDLIDMNDSRYEGLSSNGGMGRMSRIKNGYEIQQSPHRIMARNSDSFAEGRINNQIDGLNNMTPRMYAQNQNLFSTQRLNDSGYPPNSKGSAVTSERTTLQQQRSSAEASEIERELNKHQRYQKNGSSSIDKNYDPENMKKQIQMSMQIQLQNLINKLNEKEKQYMDNERQYSKLQSQLTTIDNKTSKMEVQLKDETNRNAQLRTQMNFLIQTQFGVDKTQKMLQRFMLGNHHKRHQNQ